MVDCGAKGDVKMVPWNDRSMTTSPPTRALPWIIGLELMLVVVVVWLVASRLAWGPASLLILNGLSAPLLFDSRLVGKARRYDRPFGVPFLVLALAGLVAVPVSIRVVFGAQILIVCGLAVIGPRFLLFNRDDKSPLMDSSAASDATDTKKTDGDGAPSEDKAQNKD